MTNPCFQYYVFFLKNIGLSVVFLVEILMPVLKCFVPKTVLNFIFSTFFNFEGDVNQKQRKRHPENKNNLFLFVKQERFECGV